MYLPPEAITKGFFVQYVWFNNQDHFTFCLLNPAECTFHKLTFVVKQAVVWQNKPLPFPQSHSRAVLEVKGETQHTVYLEILLAATHFNSHFN